LERREVGRAIEKDIAHGCYRCRAASSLLALATELRQLNERLEEEQHLDLLAVPIPADV
jgi:hypothetical protein